MHNTTRGDPCCYPDGHTYQHRTRRDREYIRRYNHTKGVLNAQRYRARHPDRRALTIIKHQEKVDGREV